MGTAAIVLIAIVVAILLLAFVPFVRSVVGALIRIAFFLFVIFVAIAGFSILRNNETIYATPGFRNRVSRFLTVNWANTSEKGMSDAPCAIDQHGAAAQQKPASSRKGRQKKQVARAPAPSPSASPTPSEEAAEENFYDELVTHNYLCGEDSVPIPHDKLFQMAQETVAELDGWKLISSDPRTGLLNCVYTSRIFGFQDDIRILVTPKTDVQICSQSRMGEPDATSFLRFFPGDFGANMGHIKQFYAAMQPKADQFCKILEEKQKAKQPPQ